MLFSRNLLLTLVSSMSMIVAGATTSSKTPVVLKTSTTKSSAVTTKTSLKRSAHTSTKSSTMSKTATIAKSFSSSKIATTSKTATRSSTLTTKTTGLSKTATTTSTIRQTTTTTSRTTTSTSTFLNGKPSSSSASSTSVSLTTTRSSASTSTRASTTSLTSVSSSGDTLFTGVQATIRTSQATCYSLSTPTKLLTAATASASLYLPYEYQSTFQQFFFGTNATSDVDALKYVSVAGNDSNVHVIDVSSPSALGIVISDGTSLLLHDSGVSIATANCELNIDFAIPNFAEQLSILNPSNFSQIQSQTLRRRAQQDFTVDLAFQTQCGRPPSQHLTTFVNIGPSSCLGLDVDHTYGGYRWQCQFPGKDSDEANCETWMQALLDATLGGIVGSSTNWITNVDTIAKGLKGLLSEEALSALARAAGIAFTNPASLRLLGFIGPQFLVATAILGFAETALVVYNHYSPNGLASDLCMLLYKNEFPIPLTVQAGDTYKILAQLSANPVSVGQSLKIHDPNEKSCRLCTNASNNCTSQETCFPDSAKCGQGCYCIKSIEDVQFCAWPFFPPYRTTFQDCYSSSACDNNWLCWATAFGNFPDQIGPREPTCMFSEPFECGFPDQTA